jgi:hypothetical protein
MDGRDYVTSFHETWLCVKFGILKLAYWTPMTEAELDAHGLFRERELPDDRNSLLTKILERQEKKPLDEEYKRTPGESTLRPKNCLF